MFPHQGRISMPAGASTGGLAPSERKLNDWLPSERRRVLAHVRHFASEKNGDAAVSF
jgi:hypothetical protein